MSILVVIPAYKVSEWIRLSINILKLQSYTDWRCVIVDDCSPDDSYTVMLNETQDDDRFEVVQNKENNGSSLANYIKGFDIANPADEDVVVWVDGDDWLASNFVLEHLVQKYEDNDIWMTYNTAISYPSGGITSSRYVNIPDRIYDKNDFRSYDWSYNISHLRTHKAFLFRAIDRKDMWDDTEYYREANDTAYLYPMQEMSGRKQYRNDEITLVLNRANPLNDAKINLDKQKQNEHTIRCKPRYSLLER